MVTIDQATQLRRLVLRSAMENPSAGAPPPRLIVVAGSQGRVGTTTVAVNLAAAIADQGLQVVLVDCDLYSPHVARLCGLGEQGGVGDVLAARRDIHEILQRGPAGIQVACGSRFVSPGEFSEAGQRRLLRQLKSLGRHAETAVIDVGSAVNDTTMRFWKAADELALVVTPDPTSVMDAYASIKRAASEGTNARIGLIVNRVDSELASSDVHRRIDRSCQRFLGIDIDCLGAMPESDQIRNAVDAPLLVQSPESPLISAIEAIVSQLLRRRDSENVKQTRVALPASTELTKVATSP